MNIPWIDQDFVWIVNPLTNVSILYPLKIFDFLVFLGGIKWEH